MKPKRVTDWLRQARKRLGNALAVLGILFSIFSVGSGLVERDIPFKWSITWRDIFEAVLGWSLVASICAVVLILLSYIAEWLVRVTPILNVIASHIQCAFKRVTKFLLTPRWTYGEALNLLVLVLLVPLASTLLGVHQRNHNPLSISGDSAMVYLPTAQQSVPGARLPARVRLVNTSTDWWLDRWLCRVDDVHDLRSANCVRIPTVPPGESADVSLMMRAPTTPGSYTALFKIVSADGAFAYPEYHPVRFNLKVV